MSRVGQSSAARVAGENATTAASTPSAANAVRRKLNANAMMFLPGFCSCFYGHDHGEADRTSSTIFRLLVRFETTGRRCPLSDVLPCVMVLARGSESG